ncbi:sensor histidine kinase [Labrys monachus]|uniref:histidine kinase n=1 Tax=Labrys monachus TaxID=217067 RepID=A0ABU0F7L3_9HYPH|nr:sensor histidine kinase KdpD [Labrys monachus]MDQ0390598.1 two-component system sensor histidine kinase KdpD [Labrys monachus]
MPLPARDTDARPDPNALLALAGREGRGRLTVFLGAAPGVGKTYAMLSRARRERDAGVDVVIGIAETHGRAETAALIEGLEVLPRRRIDYRGRALEEFDIDAALARRPRLIVVDELAHSNAPDSRHPKRYQDVEELIGAGIDVWTAVNIQHLESLVDVVSRITGVTVRESVPDSVLKKADEVIVVDITPTELIQRLEAGKVYLPENARRATEGFFKPGNLTALRELALRRTTDRVDDQMIDYLRQNAIEGPWETADRLLVCIGTDALSEKVVRTAGRLANGLNAHWLVVTIERPGQDIADPVAMHRLDQTFLLAERLGAETRRVSGHDYVGEILRLARRENATQIVLGRGEAGWWRRIAGRSLPDALLRRSSDIGIYVVTSEDTEPPPTPGRRPRLALLPMAKAGALAVGSVAAAVAIGLGLQHFVPLPNVSMLFLMAVLLCALTIGRTAAIAAAILSFFTYNFFFIAPVYTFTIAEPHELFALVIFLIVAVTTGDLAGRVRDRAEGAGRRAASTQALYEFSRKLSGITSVDDVLWAAAAHAQATLGGRVILAVPIEDELTVTAAWPPDIALDTTDMTALRWAFEKRENAGRGTGTLPNLAFQYRPLLTPHGAVGVFGFERPEGGPGLTPTEDRILVAILDQTAIAVDRARLARDSARTAALEESEKLRSALFSSISHDLRTPLASITGAVTSLRQLGERMSAASRDDLLASIEEEAARLSRFVSNLLDMTRIEAGALNARRDWVDIADVVRAAADRARKAFPDRAIDVSIAPDLPPVRGDSALLGQVLFNLIDNAHKYGAADTPTAIYARREGGEVLISVIDQGKGIPPADLERIFDKFYRRGKVDGRAAGTGLGLSICRGFVEAMGGTIVAESPAVRKRGTRIVIRLPIAA